jgi:hypothetical protein
MTVRLLVVWRVGLTVGRAPLMGRSRSGELDCLTARSDLDGWRERDRRRLSVAVDRQLEVQRLGRADLVVDGQETADVVGQRGAVGDLVAVQVFVLGRLKEALDHAVGLGRLMARADVRELGTLVM